MRIVSLLPACTEWVAALGAADQLVGRSHACDYPPDVRALPVLTRPGAAGDRLEVNPAETGAVLAAISPFRVESELLERLQPDVVLTQTLCDACAVTESQLCDYLADRTGGTPRIFSMRARSFKQVLDDALALGRAIDRTPAAMQLLGALEVRLQGLRRRLGLKRIGPDRDAPTVGIIEWLDPLMTAGHWTPDLIELAGGRPLVATAGARSEELDWLQLLESDPDFVIVIPCGLNLTSAAHAWERAAGRHPWTRLRAVREGRAFLFDGNAYFNRPGPRLYRSVELLADTFHGERAGVEVRPEERRAIVL